MTELELTAKEYELFCNFIEAQCGIALGPNKQYLVRSRLMPLVRQFNAGTLSHFISLVLKSTNKELAMLALDVMTTNETLWFRDVYPFQYLVDTIIPELTKQNKSLRIWSAACSSGQEPFSMAIALKELAIKQPNYLQKQISILATDISDTMLAHCSKGLYDPIALSRGLSPARKQTYFKPHGTTQLMQIDDSIQKMVQFRKLNLLSNYSSLGKFDVIFCRNVLIYFSKETKTKVIEQMTASLNKGGYLILGASESLTGLSDKFEMIRCFPGLVYRLKE